MSNVTAVENAQAAKQAAELKAKKEISYYKELANDKISDAISKKNDAISKSKKEVALAKKHEKIAWGSLLATLFCCLIAYPTFLYDIGSFILEPISWIMEALNDYAAWLEQPYYSRYVNGTERLYAYSLGMTWLLRVTSLILITSLTAGGCYGIFKACLYYKSRWCSLSLKVLLVSLAVIIVFGDSIRRYVPINLVLLLILVQAAYIGIIIYLDLYFENRGEWVHWDELQNQ